MKFNCKANDCSSRLIHFKVQMFHVYQLKILSLVHVYQTMKLKFVIRMKSCSFDSDDLFVQIMKNDIVRISHESQTMRERIKENKEKIKVNKTLPYLVSNVIEVIVDQLMLTNGENSD